MSIPPCPAVLPDVAVGAVSGLVVVAVLFGLHCAVQLALSAGLAWAAVPDPETLTVP